MVKWFDESEKDSSSEDLPWAKDYAKTVSSFGGVYTVQVVYVTPKGLLVMFDRFKAFIFKRQKMYEFILEALTVWAEDRTIPCCLVGKLNQDSTIAYGLDDEVKITYWEREGDRYTAKSLGGGGTKPTPSSNPLLPLYMESSGVPPATIVPQEGIPTKRASRRP